MKKYTVMIPLGAVAIIEVEADSKEEAIEKAISNGYPPSLCHQCANEVDIGELYDEDKAEAYETEE